MFANSDVWDLRQLIAAFTRQIGQPTHRDAPYLTARQDGSSPEKASAGADGYMEEVLHILPR